MNYLHFMTLVLKPKSWICSWTSNIWHCFPLTKGKTDSSYVQSNTKCQQNNIVEFHKAIGLLEHERNLATIGGINTFLFTLYCYLRITNTIMANFEPRMGSLYILLPGSGI